jgi:cell division protein FtsL
MSRTYHHGKRRIRVKGIRRKEPDLRKLGRALIEFARMQAENEAEADHARTKASARKARPPSKPQDQAEPPAGDAA